MSDEHRKSRLAVTFCAPERKKNRLAITFSPPESRESGMTFADYARRGTAIVVAYVLLMTGLGYVDDWLAKPPAGATLGSFHEFLPEPQRIVLVEHNGKPFAVVFGRDTILSESPAWYLFDQSGRLVRWDYEGVKSNTFWGLAQDKFDQDETQTYASALAGLAARAR